MVLLNSDLTNLHKNGPQVIELLASGAIYIFCRLIVDTIIWRKINQFLAYYKEACLSFMKGTGAHDLGRQEEASSEDHVETDREIQ